MRLSSDLLAKALVRRVHDAGGSAMILARGDAMGGAILVLGLDRGVPIAFWERGIDPKGQPMLVRAGPESLDPESADAYWRRRRTRDPDLWIIEADVASVERFVAETIVNH